MITRSILHAGRAAEIFGVLVKYGFGDIAQEIGLDQWIRRGRSFLGRPSPDEEKVRLPHEVRVRHALEDLGPTFVKFGQILSTRPDLIPTEWANEFSKLQDDVRRVPFEEIRKRLEKEFPGRVDELFESIEEEPIAAASLAQVHRAVLRGSGEHIVLKILRPGIQETINADLELLTVLAEFAEDRFQDLGYSPKDVLHHFSREMRRELDLQREGRSTDRFREQFEDQDGVRFPRVFWEATTDHVLALEEITGTRLSQLDPETLSTETRNAIVRNGAFAVFKQCLEFGFFHADPHPGNIFVLEDGKICFIDCGMTGHVDPKTTERLAILVQSVISADLDRVIDAVLSLADADRRLADDHVFRSDVWDFISRFENVSFDTLDMGKLLEQFFERIRQHRLRCPANIVFLIKAITTIESVGERIAPEFDLVSYVRPFVERLVHSRFGIRALRRRLRDSFLGYAELLETLPNQLKTIFVDLHHNRLTINLEHQGLERLTRTIEHASRNVSTALLISAMVIGSSILLLADQASGNATMLSTLAVVGFLVAVFLAIVFIFSNRRQRKLDRQSSRHR